MLLRHDRAVKEYRTKHGNICPVSIQVTLNLLLTSMNPAMHLFFSELQGVS